MSGSTSSSSNRGVRAGNSIDTQLRQWQHHHHKEQQRQQGDGDGQQHVHGWQLQQHHMEQRQQQQQGGCNITAKDCAVIPFVPNKHSLGAQQWARLPQEIAVANAGVLYCCSPAMIAFCCSCDHPCCLQVVDRVLLQSGSQKWWAALIGRGKMQRAWNQHSTLNIVSDNRCTRTADNSCLLSIILVAWLGAPE